MITTREVDEQPNPNEDPTALALRLARSKAEAVLSASNGDLPVLAADTVVAVGGELLGKPADALENARFLERLSGVEHQVITGHALYAAGRWASEAPVTTVRFRELSRADIDWYSASGEGLDKAGGYGLQGLGAALIEHVEGDHTNVIGLSIPAVLRLFNSLGVTRDG